MFRASWRKRSMSGQEHLTKPLKIHQFCGYRAPRCVQRLILHPARRPAPHHPEALSLQFKMTSPSQARNLQSIRINKNQYIIL